MTSSERPTAVWRRVDIDGREAATIHESQSGWRLFGVAEFREAEGASCLAYVIDCDRAWQTRSCEITGFMRRQPVSITIHRDAFNAWTVDGRPAAPVTGCVDIDLSFSPVTNVLPIRRLLPARGEIVHVRAAWLRVPELTLEPLDQTYTRVGQHHYSYESGGGTFRRELTVDDRGLVIDYPGLWTSLK